MFVETWCYKQRDGRSILKRSAVIHEALQFAMHSSKIQFFDIMVGFNGSGGKGGKIVW